MSNYQAVKAQLSQEARLLNKIVSQSTIFCNTKRERDNLEGDKYNHSYSLLSNDSSPEIYRKLTIAGFLTIKRRVLIMHLSDSYPDIPKNKIIKKVDRFVAYCLAHSLISKIKEGWYRVI